MLEEKILSDYKDAMRAKDSARVQTVSFLRSELKYAAIDKKKDKLADEDVVAVVKKLIKQRQDSICQFEKGGRQDLVAKEKAELEILQSYLPVQMEAGAVAAVVDSVIAAMGSVTMKDMGKIIKEVMVQTQGRADGKMISDTVRVRLESSL